jgi:hypothetical protein
VTFPGSTAETLPSAGLGFSTGADLGAGGIVARNLLSLDAGHFSAGGRGGGLEGGGGHFCFCFCGGLGGGGGRSTVAWEPGFEDGDSEMTLAFLRGAVVSSGVSVLELSLSSRGRLPSGINAVSWSIESSVLP